MRRVFAIIGPTAVGKTEIALDLAGEYNMAILSCDSMQIYKGMDIGSAKASKEEQETVPHFMLDVVDPTESYSVVNYQREALKAIDEIIAQGKIPLIAGGTGLYLDSLIYDIDYGAKPPEESQREELYQLAERDGPEALYKILEEIDGDSAARIHPNNIKRVVRAIESAREGIGISPYDRKMQLRDGYEFVIIGLKRDRQELYDRINKRVDIMMEKGLVEEVKSLYEKGLTSKDYSMKGIGYKELFPYIEGNMSLEECIIQIKTNSRHYAKRQMTWFSKYENITWFDLTGVESKEEYFKVEDDIKKWLTKEL